ncbi:inositol monophosphatase family protein [Hydrogenimonas cancrithermarum]|uniref:Inositol-1-monophosphatase n=1 Tax=Hydrogenimonas cancrithermarum TaxID=2993563 RepID=A0ABM8FHW5_9BACT|nr:inositol monophosphatase family protein [Hydrogenimonas cancrithermarum]BDY11881.1 inositol monophosphatase [Hydrogenimonas cancrithermarum]
MLNKLIEIVLEAGKLFEEGFNAVKEVHHKGTVDLVTQFDVAVENLLKERIADALPAFTIIGEESSDEHQRADRAIYIDPIDGTTNFIHKIPLCAISIGVWEDGVPVAGIVYNPVLNELFSAGRGEGAFCNGKKIVVSETADLQQSLLATGFPYTKVEMGRDFRWVLETMENLLPHTQDIRRLGAASIDLSYVANGIFDGFYECNLKPWDVAAGILLVEEAGGKVSNHRGEPYRLGDPVIVATNGRNHEALVEKLADYEEA